MQKEHNLTHRDLFNLVQATHDFCTENEIPYAIVGGVGVQSHLVNSITHASGGPTSISEDRRNSNIFGWLLRNTNDIDVVMLTDRSNERLDFEIEKYLIQNLPNFSGLTPKSGTLKVNTNRSEISLQVTTDSVKYKGFEESLFEYQVDSANELELIYSERGPVNRTNVKVPTSEILALPKLSRYSVSDMQDLQNLIRITRIHGQGFDKNAVKSIAKRYAPNNSHTLVSRLDEIMSTI